VRIEITASRARAAAMLTYAKGVRLIEDEIDEAQLHAFDQKSDPLRAQTPDLVEAQDALERARMSEWTDDEPAGLPQSDLPYPGDLRASMKEAAEDLPVIAELLHIAAVLKRRTA
jgi:hypothetical protein